MNSTVQQTRRSAGVCERARESVRSRARESVQSRARSGSYLSLLFPKKLRQDEGNVESALVLIPLLILFMISVELIVATNLRNSDFALAQADASRRAISGEVRASDQVIELDSPDSFAHMKLLVSHRKHSLPQLVPGLMSLIGGHAVVEVNGVAVMETLN